MNKAELIAVISEKTSMSKATAKAVLEAFTDTVAEELKAGNKVELIGFGQFFVKERPARIGRNPKTGEPMQIAASRQPAFKAGARLKEAFDRRHGEPPYFSYASSLNCGCFFLLLWCGLNGPR